MNYISESARERLVAARGSLAAGDLDGAEQLFSRIAREKRSAAASAGLAAVAMRRGEWADAVARWDMAMFDFADRIDLGWRKSRAHALLKLGRHNEAIEEFLRILAIDVENEMAQRGLLNSLKVTHQSERALHELDVGIFKGMATSALLYYRAEMHHGRLVSSGGGDDTPARQNFDEALRLTKHPTDLAKLMWLLPRIFTGSAKQERWADMLALTEAMQVDGSFSLDLAVLRLRLLFSLGRNDAYLAMMETMDPSALRASRLGTIFLDVAAKLRNPEASPPKTFVIGLSKTGTTSMAAALNMLGINTADFLDPLSNDLVSFETSRFYDGLADTPASLQFERLAESYPDARFIYTVRPVASWKRSFIAHHHRHHGWPDFATMKSTMARAASGLQGDPASEGLTGGMNRIWYTLFTQYDSLSDAYAAHDDRVRRYFTGEGSGRLLVFDTFNGDGWPELCGFLCKPVPARSYPMVNVNPMGVHAATAA